MKNLNILITGGMGLLGYSMIKYFSEKNYIKKIISIDSREIEFLKITNRKVKYIKTDINNKFKIEQIIRKNEINVIFHTAAVTQVLEGFINPSLCYKTNILGTINLLECVRKFKKNVLFIFSSSDKAYGKLKSNNTYSENDKLIGDFTYDASKSASDLIVQSYSKTYKLNIGIVRSGNIYGPGDINFERLIPGLALKSIENKNLLLRSNGKNRRDYIFVDDVVLGYKKIMEKMIKSKSKRLFIYNLGSSYNYTVLKVCEIFLKEIKKRFLKPIIKNNSEIEIPYQKLNYSKIKKELGWKPKINFNLGIKLTYNWYLKNYKNIKSKKLI